MKGNSERVPGKNIRRLGGVPLFYHILTALENAEYVAEIIVNTDSREIKELINKDFSNVVVIDRPDFLLGNKVPMTPIIEYDLKFIKTKHFLQTHATCPFIKP